MSSRQILTLTSNTVHASHLDHDSFLIPDEDNCIDFLDRFTKHRYIVTPLHRYAVTPLHRYIITPLHRYIIMPLCRYIVTSLRRYVVTPLRRYIVTSLHRYVVACIICTGFRLKLKHIFLCMCTCISNVQYSFKYQARI